MNTGQQNIKIFNYCFVLFFCIITSLKLCFSQNEEKYEIFVIQEDWHTGIVFHTHDVDSSIWPEIVRYRDDKFLDVGWGDERFYQVPGYPVFTAARAVLWPTQSVLRVFPYSNPVPSAYLDDSRILKITITKQELDNLSLFIAKSYERDENGNVKFSQLYENNKYYFLANRNYHLFRTCNTWVALGFKKSDFNVRSFFVLYGKQLFRQLRDIPGAEYQ